MKYTAKKSLNFTMFFVILASVLISSSALAKSIPNKPVLQKPGNGQASSLDLSVKGKQANLFTDTVDRVSLDSNEVGGNSNSQSPSISADGRYAVFSSVATNLVSGDTNGVEDVFLRDRQGGTTTRVSLGLSGAEANGASSLPTISPDGRYIGFMSSATNLVANDTNGYSDTFIYDSQTGITIAISVDQAGAMGNNDSDAPSVSPDGNYWIFASLANNLVSGDTLFDSDLFLYSQSTGSLTRVGMSNMGIEPDGQSTNAVLSTNALGIAFQSSAYNLDGIEGSPEYVDVNNAPDIFYYNGYNNTLSRISVNNAGQTANGGSVSPAISADGRYVVFSSSATNLIADDYNAVSDIFLFDVTMHTIMRVSLGDYGQEANGDSNTPAISSDGRYVAFTSTANNLVTDDVNGASDLFVRDLLTGDTRLVSVRNNYNPSEGPSAVQGNNNSSGRISFAKDGTYLVYGSSASNLVDGDTNNANDIFATNFVAVENWAYFTATPAATMTLTPTPTLLNQIIITGNAGVAWATLKYTDTTLKMVVADANGNYSLPISSNWSGTVTVSRMGYTFSPASKTYSYVSNSQTSQNYTATQSGWISAGANNTCLVKKDTGTLACWGDSGYNMNYPPTGVFTQVSVGDYHACALNSAAAIICWGSNNYGISTPPSGTFIQVSAGSDYSCAIKTDLTVVCWGLDSMGETIPPSGQFVQISAGHYHTCGVKSNGALVCWGDGYMREDLPPSGEFTEVSMGYGDACALQSDGKRNCWTYSGNTSLPLPTETYTQISEGAYYGCGLQLNNTLSCWGQNPNGESTPPSGTYIQVTAGKDHACAMMSNGKTTCWGANNLKQSLPFNISGDTGAGYVTLSYTDGDPKTIISYGVGTYTISVPYDWSGTVIPSLAGYVFSPASRIYTNVQSDKFAQDYIAVLAPTATRTATKTATATKTPTPTATPVSVTFTSIAIQDGQILESTETSGVGGTMNNNYGNIAIGDDAGNRQLRGILSFGTASLPDNAIIQSAILKIKYNAVVGQDPFVAFNNLWADMDQGSFGSTALELTDFNETADVTAVGAFNKTPVNGWYSLTLNAAGRSHVNLVPGGTQFRLYFNPDDNNNNTADFMQFYSGDSLTTANYPVLIITYTLP